MFGFIKTFFDSSIKHQPLPDEEAKKIPKTSSKLSHAEKWRIIIEKKSRRKREKREKHKREKKERKERRRFEKECQKQVQEPLFKRLYNKYQNRKQHKNEKKTKEQVIDETIQSTAQDCHFIIPVIKITPPETASIDIPTYDRNPYSTDYVNILPNYFDNDATQDTAKETKIKDEAQYQGILMSIRHLFTRGESTGEYNDFLDYAASMFTVPISASEEDDMILKSVHRLFIKRSRFLGIKNRVIKTIRHLFRRDPVETEYGELMEYVAILFNKLAYLDPLVSYERTKDGTEVIVDKYFSDHMDETDIPNNPYCRLWDPKLKALLKPFNHPKMKVKKHLQFDDHAEAVCFFSNKPVRPMKPNQTRFQAFTEYRNMRYWKEDNIKPRSILKKKLSPYRHYESDMAYHESRKPTALLMWQTKEHIKSTENWEYDSDRFMQQVDYHSEMHDMYKRMNMKCPMEKWHRQPNNPEFQDLTLFT